MGGCSSVASLLFTVSFGDQAIFARRGLNSTRVQQLSSNHSQEWSRIFNPRRPISHNPRYVGSRFSALHGLTNAKVQLWGAIVYIFIAFLTDRYKKRYLFVIIFTPITALGYALLLSPVAPGVEYFACFVITTGMYIIAGNNLAWCSANSAPDGKRGATVGIFLTLTDLAGGFHS